MSFNKIQILPKSVAERIAAGEVIERPSSVVKELVENSIDAKATQIQIRLEDGGKSLIEIIDNGHGMSPEDLELSIKRHATSKLKTLDDLDQILTLGFRGEALPSIAAVTDLKITSKVKDLSQTFQIHPTSVLESAPTSELETKAYAVTHGHFFSSPHGTKIEALGLFSSVPARLKFLKSSGAEISHVKEWLERLALSHPEIGFTLISGDKTIFKVIPSSLTQRVAKILGEEQDYPIQSFVHHDEASGIEVQCHWVQGLSLPSFKKLVQVVNGRAVKDKVIQQAVMQNFRQSLMPGQFPALLIDIKIAPDQLDVNVHPTKAEVRFLNSSHVFKVIDKTISKCIQQAGVSSFVPGPLQTEQPSYRPIYQPFTQLLEPAKPILTTQAQTQEQSIDHHPLTPAWSPAPQTFEQKPFEFASPQVFLVDQIKNAKWIGRIFQTYILLESQNAHEILVIDQHAAHERVQFEKLSQRLQKNLPLETQSLLIPEVITLEDSQFSELQSKYSLLTDIGFELESFGNNSVIFRAIPAEWGQNDLKIRLRNLIEKVTDSFFVSAYGGPHWDEKLFEVLASRSCKSAIKAGDSLDEIQVHALIEQWLKCQHPWNCPHGRPVLTKIPQARFEEWFLRKI